MKQPAPNKMIRRDKTWDYRQPAIYMITLTLRERRPILGTLVVPEEDGIPCAEKASVKLSAAGEIVEKGLLQLERQTPELKVLQYQIMPDHLHAVLQVTHPMEHPIGRLIGLLKHKTDLMARAAEGQCASMSASAGERTDTAKRPTQDGNPSSMMATLGHQHPASLWAPGFNDNRLRTRGQLQAMIRYVHDNPRRLAVRRLHPGVLSVMRGVEIADAAYDAVGNMALLMQEKRAVHVRSRWTAEEKRAYKNSCILAAREGTVLTGPFISPDERDVLRVALEERLPLICLQENGFPEFFKPGGELFDACAEGRLLLLAPWPYHSRRQAITRAECLALNRMAASICGLLPED